MANTTNYNWETPDDTDLVKDGAAAIRTLGTAIDTTVFNNASAGIAKTIVDAKGDIIAATAADTVSRLAVGANDTVLTADSSTATGLKWATPAAGGMTLLSTTSTNGAGSYTLSSINQTYKKLVLVGTSISKTNTASVRIYPQDGTTDLNLGYQWTCAGNTTNTLSTYALWPDDNNGYVATSNPLNFVLEIDNYASSSEQKPFTFYGGFNRSSVGNVGFFVFGSFFANNPVNKITVYSDYNFNGGTLKLYGVN